MSFKFLPLFILLLLQSALINAQDLKLTSSDLWISQGADGGFHLYIRRKAGVSSVLLTETTRDPTFREPNYAYRAKSWNPVNGNEMRLLDGVPIPQGGGSWSLIDSTPEYLSELGAEVFHIYIPYIIYYGYDTTRHGVVQVGNGTYLNIRTFALPYADYRGSFMDNPFILEIAQAPLAGPPELNFMRDTEDAFLRITWETGGRLFRSVGPEDIVKAITGIIKSEIAANPYNSRLELVFALDTTASMQNDIAAIKRNLVQEARELTKSFDSISVGLVLYRDYKDAYITKIIPFTSNLQTFQSSLSAIRAVGGRDIPEAVDEALYDAATQFVWSRDALKLIILIGDAPPHPVPLGSITEDMALNAAKARNIKIDAIILPQ